MHTAVAAASSVAGFAAASVQSVKDEMRMREKSICVTLPIPRSLNDQRRVAADPNEFGLSG